MFEKKTRGVDANQDPADNRQELVSHRIQGNHSAIASQIAKEQPICGSEPPSLRQPGMHSEPFVHRQPLQSSEPGFNRQPARTSEPQVANQPPPHGEPLL